MTLRTKFGLVFLLLAATLAVNVGASVWGLRFLNRELAWPLQSIQQVMSGLHEIKRAGEAQALAIGSGRVLTQSRTADPSADPDRELRAELSRLDAEIESVHASLDAVPTQQVRSGISSMVNLRDRSRSIAVLIDQWLETERREQFDELVSALDARHELIERIEGRILADAALAVDHGQRLRRLVLLIVIVSVAGAVAMAALMVLLVRRWLLVPIEAIRSGAERYGSGDLTHRIELNSGDELGRLGDEFNEMAELIQRMQDERIERERLAAMGEMARRIVHNLRTPLSGIRTLAETTRSELADGSDLIPVQDRIISSVDRFEGWLREMLRASSPIELSLRPFEPRALVESVADAHRDAACASDVVFLCDIDALPTQAVGDPGHLEHALTALLSNALEFAPRGSEVAINGRSEAGYWSVEVVDSGPGVPEALQAEIFRPYFTTRQGGTGIGLALVKRVAEQHGGTIGVRSPADPDSGSGTAFVLRIPVAPDARPSD